MNRISMMIRAARGDFDCFDDIVDELEWCTKTMNFAAEKIDKLQKEVDRLVSQQSKDF